MSGIADYGAGVILDAIFNNTALQKANRYVQLHIYTPGSTGTQNVATETTRKSVTGAASAFGTFTSTNALTWASYPATEIITDVSIWDASGAGAGNCLWTGPMLAPISVTSGGTFTIAAGALVVSIP